MTVVTVTDLGAKIFVTHLKDIDGKDKYFYTAGEGNWVLHLLGSRITHAICNENS